MGDSSGLGRGAKLERGALPHVLAELSSASGERQVERWWAALSEPSRAELAALWDARAESVAHASVRAGFEALPIELRGVWVDPELARDNAMWTQQLVEYINAHPEIRFHMQERRFHICRAHPAARAVVRRGVIPAGFACPLGRAGCPLAGAARAGGEHAIHLVPA